MNNLVTLQQLFENRVFKIPNYQRGYSWENEHRQDMLEDLESIKDKRHYTGTIVLRKSGDVSGFGESYAQYDVVDGQQRLTTVIIFLNEIKKEFHELKIGESKQTAENLEKRYVKYQGPQGAIYKLELDQDNDQFFKQEIINSIKDEKKIKSHYRLQDAKNQFSRYLKAKKEEQKTTYPNYLNLLVKKLTQLLVFTIYEVENDAEVGIIFEVMNDRGKPLSQLEKVKNFLLYQTDRISWEDVSRNEMTNYINYSWKEILQNLSASDKSSNEDENQFLRINFITNFYSTLSTSKKDDEGKKISINSQLSDVQSLMKEHFKKNEKDKEKCYKEIKEYISSLKNMSYKYKDLNRPYDSNSFKGVDKRYIESIIQAASQLDRLDIQSNILPMILASYERYEKEPLKLLEIMRLLEVLVFRIYYIASYRSHSAQSQLYTLANEVYNSRIDYSRMINVLKEIIRDYCSDNTMDSQLANPENNYDWGGLLYFLYEYERKRCLEETKKRPAFEWEQLKKMKREDSIEHILPQKGKAVPYWRKRFKGNAYDNNFDRLGNLTLSTRNSQLGNNGFDRKKLIYKNSRWQIERDIAGYNDWTEKSITKREKELIEFAKQRWSI